VQRQHRRDDVRLIESGNAGSEQLLKLMMPTKQLTDWEWLLGEHLNGSKGLAGFRYEVSDLFSEVILPSHKNKGFPSQACSWKFTDCWSAGKQWLQGYNKLLHVKYVYKMLLPSCWLLDHHNNIWQKDQGTEWEWKHRR